MMKRISLSAAAGLLAWAAPGAGQAPTPLEEPLDPPLEAPLGVPASVDVYGSVEILSDYRFRGVSRSDEDPALQANLTLSHRSGAYAGARATTLEGNDPLRARIPQLVDAGHVEFDLYAGYLARLGSGWELDAGTVYYAFVGGEGPTDYVEPFASLSYLIGPVYATAGAKYAPSQRATGDQDMLYLFGQVDVTVPFRPWSFTASVGRQDWGRFDNHWNWSIGVRHQVRLDGIPDTELGLSYVDTDLPSRAGQDAGLVGSLSLRF